MCLKTLWRSSRYITAFSIKWDLKKHYRNFWIFPKRALTVNQWNVWTSVSGAPIGAGQVGRLTLAGTRLWEVEWIAAGTMSHSRGALRQGWIERHRERLSGNRALLSGHRRGPEWRIITEELCATRTLTSLTVWYLFLRGVNTYNAVLVHPLLSFSSATFYSFSSTEAFFFCSAAWRGIPIPLPFQIKAGCVSANVWESTTQSIRRGRTASFLSASRMLDSQL